MGEMWAWMVGQGPDGEGLVSLHDPQIGWTPLVSLSETTAVDLQEFARRHATTTGRPVVLARFHERTDVMTIQPEE